jgi:hypothetical protein
MLPEGGGDFGATKISSSEDEYPRVACSQRANIQGAVSQPLILGEQDYVWVCTGAGQLP